MKKNKNCWQVICIREEYKGESKITAVGQEEGLGLVFVVVQLVENFIYFSGSQLQVLVLEYFLYYRAS